MSSLYQINEKVDSIMAKIQSAFDESTGEIIDEELYLESQKELDNLEIAQNDKIENLACFIKNLHSEVFALENEIKTFSQRKKVKENQLKRVKEYLENFLKFKEIKKIETPKAVLSFRKSEQLDIVDEPKVLEWLKQNESSLIKYKEPEIDKAGLKKYIKLTGEVVPSVQIVEKQNLQIK
jgi:outer membrane murein-binding lipoprotein Lpp